MFGKLMNNFYYGKSGKGDYRKEDLPKNRWQLFWEMLRIRFSALIRLNLMYVVVWLPAMAVLMIAAMYILTLASQVATAEETTQNFLTNLSGNTMLTLMLLVPCIAITGPCTAGVCYVTRNWARDEHAFIWSDFKDAVKENWEAGAGYLRDYGAFAAGGVCMLEFLQRHGSGKSCDGGSSGAHCHGRLHLALAVTYFYPLMVSYKLKMRELLRNGLLLAVARLPFSFAVRLLHVVPTVIALICAFFFSPVWSVLGLFLYYLVFGFGLSRFVTASYTNAVFDRFINSRIEGAVINRGLSQETDDDDDEEEENPQA